jgi:hypothetical protein
MGTVATMTYPRRFLPLAVALAVVGMTAMVMAVLQFQGPLMSRHPAPRPAVTRWDSAGWVNAGHGRVSRTALVNGKYAEFTCTLRSGQLNNCDESN